MNLVVEQFLERIRGAWRFRTAAVITATVVAALGWLTVLAWPDSFEASSRVFVNTSTALRPLLQGIAVDQDIDAQLNMVRESLLGRPRLEHVARDADLDVKAKTPEDFDRLIARLQATILIDAQAPRSSGRENRSSDSIYTITYRNTSRDKALAVVRSLLNALMEDTMSGKRAGAGNAQKFLADQIKDYESRLSVAEGRLAEFKKQNVGLVPGQQGDYFSRLQNEMLASKKAESQLEVALGRRNELERQLRGEKPFSASAGTLSPKLGSGAGRAGGLVPIDTDSRIAEAQARLDDLLLRYTDKHPDVLAARETLAQLKERQKTELAALKRGDPSAAATAGLAANPVYQSIQLQMNQTEVEIAALRGELADHRRTEAELRRVVNTAPGVEAEFARLTRDYLVEKTQYNALVERLEKAKLSEDAADTGIVQFQIINPPTADLVPVAPNRPLLIAAVLIAALGCGVAVAWLLAEQQPVFSNTRALRELTGLAVLGSVRRTWVEQYHTAMRRSLYMLAGSMAGLLVAFVLVITLHESGSRLIHRLIDL
jgi:polysaccharide chain length determinant protein (PEP-CTERM system associated)